MLLDIIILLCLLLGIYIGYKRGVIHTTVGFLGSFLVIIIAFLLKNNVSVMLYQNLPFFNLGGITILNIVVYEIISFTILFLCLFTLFRIIVGATKLVEKILEYTKLLGLPSKLAGALVGGLEAYTYLFIALYVMSSPLIHTESFDDSKLKETILMKTPFLSPYIDKTLATVEEIKDFKDKYMLEDDKESLNGVGIDLFLKHRIVSVGSVEKLVNSGKLKVKNIDSIIDKYR